MIQGVSGFIATEVSEDLSGVSGGTPGNLMGALVVFREASGGFQQSGRLQGISGVLKGFHLRFRGFREGSRRSQTRFRSVSESPWRGFQWVSRALKRIPGELQGVSGAF